MEGVCGGGGSGWGVCGGGVDVEGEWVWMGSGWGGVDVEGEWVWRRAWVGRSGCGGGVGVDGEWMGRREWVGEEVTILTLLGEAAVRVTGPQDAVLCVVCTEKRAILYNNRT